MDELTPGHTVENLAYPTVATWKSASRPGDPPPQTGEAGEAGEAGEINCTLLALISDRASKFAPTAPDSTALPHNRLSDSA